MRRVCQFWLCSPGLHCSGPIQPRPMAMERHPGAPSMISVRGVRRSGASFGISSHADKKSPAAIEAFATTIRVGRDRLDSPNAAARLIAKIEPRLGVMNVLQQRRRGMLYDQLVCR